MHRVDEISMLRWQKDAYKGALKEVCAERDRYRNGAIQMAYDVEQILGKALGYPRYRDDLKNFPDCTDDSVCVGDHVPESLASEAAERIVYLERELHGIRRNQGAVSQDSDCWGSSHHSCAEKGCRRNLCP